MEYGFKQPEHEEFPPIVHIENTNRCNLKCVHCPQSDLSKIPNYKPKTIETHIVDKAIVEVGEHNGILRYTPDGEPLIQRESFIYQIAHAFNSGIKCISLNTNGLLLVDKGHYDLINFINDLTEPIKLIIEVSLDALYKSTYEAIRKGSNYEKVMLNIFLLLDVIKQHKLQDQIKVVTSIVNLIDQSRELEICNRNWGKDKIDFEDYCGEVYQGFKRFWEPIVDKVLIRNFADTKGLVGQKKQCDSKFRRPCVVPFTRIVVDYDGNIRFCPDDWKKESVIGNIENMTIKEAWQSDKMKQLRENHLNEKFCDTPCDYCTDWQAIDWDNDYLKVIKDLFDE